MRKRTDFFNIELSDDVNFIDLLNAEIFREHAWTSGHKSYEIKFLEQRGEITVGILITTQVSDLPPSHVPRTEAFEIVRLPDGAGLSYANVFLYAPDINVLIYEINGNGCHPSTFSAFIRGVTSGNESFPRYTMEMNPIITENAFNKIMSFRYFQKVEIKIAKPLNLVEQHFAARSPIRTLVNQSAQFGAGSSSSMVLNSSVKTNGLAGEPIREYFEDFRRLVGLNEKNKVVISGSTSMPDETDFHVDPVDLVADKMKDWIELDDSTDENLQSLRRKREIVNVYNRKRDILERMFRRDAQ